MCRILPEVIDLFLTPWIKKKDIQHCLIQAGDLYPIISGEAGPWDIKTYPYFKRNHYWFFVEREPVKRGSGLVAQRRVLGPYGKLLGTWKALSANRSKIKKGRLVLGFKQKLEFITNNDLTVDGIRLSIRGIHQKRLRQLLSATLSTMKIRIK